MSKNRLSRHITWHIIIILVIYNVFVIVIAFFFNIVVSTADSKTLSQHIIDCVDSKLMIMLRSVEITASNNVPVFESNLESPEKIFDALESEQRLNNHYLGYFIGFEPDYYPNQGRWFEPYVRFVDSTHVERRQIGSPEHDYFNLEWYLMGKELMKGQGCLTDPYYDKEGNHRMITSYAAPIFDHHGRLAGVFGIDLDLNWFEKTIADEEKKVKDISLLENDPDDPPSEQFFFIQILDSKGKKIVGSESFDDKTVKTILDRGTISFEKVKLNNTIYFITSKRLAGTNWTMVVAQHRDFVFLEGYLLGGIILLLMCIGGFILLFFLRQRICRATDPLRFLTNSAEKVAQGKFDTPLPTFKRKDEISQLRDSFDTMQQSLKRYVEELQKSTAAKASIESELNVAHSIQMAMLPKNEQLTAITHHPSPITIHAILRPARAVGGDLYDFFIHDEKLFFCIGDVSGKGVPAALVMAVCCTLFRNIATHVAEPDRIVRTMNEYISENNDINMFVTLFVGIIDLTTGHLFYSNAGHDAPYLITDDCQLSIINCDSNLPVGTLSNCNYTKQEAWLLPGTTLFLYTDGLTEAENARHEQFGDQRIADTITSFQGLSQEQLPQELIDAMTDAVRQFVGDTEQSDDLTMLAIRYTGKH